MDALHDSTAFQQVFKTAAARWKSLAVHLDKVNQQYGMDLAKDLHGMTVFGPRLSQRKAVLVMRADWAAETFRQKLALAPDHTAAAEVRTRFIVSRKKTAARFGPSPRRSGSRGPSSSGRPPTR